MNVNNSSLARMNYPQMHNNSTVQAQSSQSGFSPEMLEGSETNGANDHDSDDGRKNTLTQNAQALSQLLSKQQNSVFPTTPQAQGIQSILMKSIESLYASSSKAYANNALGNLMGGMNIKA